MQQVEARMAIAQTLLPANLGLAWKRRIGGRCLSAVANANGIYYRGANHSPCFLEGYLGVLRNYGP